MLGLLMFLAMGLGAVVGLGISIALGIFAFIRIRRLRKTRKFVLLVAAVVAFGTVYLWLPLVPEEIFGTAKAGGDYDKSMANFFAWFLGYGITPGLGMLAGALAGYICPRRPDAD